MTNIDIAVVMPAYNEADGIGQFISEIAAAFFDTGMSIAIFVADDCSTDETCAVAAAAADSNGVTLTCVANEANGGHGPTSLSAWRLGLASGAGIVLHVDGDGQYRGTELVEVANAAQGRDGAIGIRATRSDPWYRKARSAGHASRTPTHLCVPTAGACSMTCLPTSPHMPSCRRCTCRRQVRCPTSTSPS